MGRHHCARWALTVALATLGAARADPPGEKIETWDVSQGVGAGVIWRMASGGSWYTGPIAVADGRLIVGVNTLKLPDQAVLLCLDAKSGKPLWRVAHDRLSDRTNDIPGAAIRSTPAVDDGRVYYISNRGELRSVGLDNGRPHWSIDMPKELGVYKRDVNDIGSLVPSAIVHGDVVYCVTGNGRSGRVNKVPSPNAPSFLAADKRTGKVIWSNNLPGENIIYGQWSQPAVATVASETMVLFPGGDGLLYAFTPAGKLLWKLDCRASGKFDRDDFIIAPPLVVGETVYVSLNRDYEQNGSRPRPLVAIDLRTGGVKWTFGDKVYTGTFGPMVESDGVLYSISWDGTLFALDAKTGTQRWKSEIDEDGQIRGGVCLHDGRLYVAGSTGQIHVLHARDGRWVGRFNLGDVGAVACTPVISGGILYVATAEHVWALRLPK